VIVTASMKILQDGDINFLPTLPSEYTDQIAKFNMSPAVTAYLEFEEEFYPEGDLYLDTDFAIYDFEDPTSKFYGVRYFFDYNYDQKINRTSILGMDTFALASEQYVGKNSSEVIDLLLEVLDIMSNDTATQLFRKGVVQDWSAEPYVKTGYTRYVLDSGTAIETLKKPIEDKIYFAGESLPDDNSPFATVFAAAQSGKRAALQIIGPSAPTVSPAPTTTVAPTVSPTTPVPTAMKPVITTRAPFTHAPTPSADKKQIVGTYDVIIVGAGAAGLTAAYCLQQANYSVIVLEASDILGGRIKKVATLGKSIDVGAQFIPAYDEAYPDPNDIVREVFESDFSIESYMEPEFYSLYSSNDNVILDEESPGMYHRWKDNTWWDFLNDQVAAKLKDGTIVYGCPVKSIDYSADKPMVVCSNGNPYESSKVIVTASMKILQDGDINFVPAMPLEYTKQMANFEMSPAVTAYLKFQEHFYPEYSLYLDTDFFRYDFENPKHELFGVRYFFDENYGADTTLNIMGFDAFALAADQYVGKSSNEITSMILKTLDLIFNDTASLLYEESIVQDWSAEPYIKTGYTKYVYDNVTAIGTFKEPIDDKIFFAGESIPDENEDWGTVHAALRSGKYAAKQIIKSLPAPTTAPTTLPTKAPTALSSGVTNNCFAASVIALSLLWIL